MSPTASASASSLPPESRPGSSLRRLGQLRSNSQTYLSPHSNPNHSSSSSQRSARNPLSRSPWFSSSQSAHNDLSSVGASLPVPCGQTDQTSFISRYRQAFFGCYRDVGVDLRASSPDSLVSVSDDSESEEQAQGNMARLRRSRTPSETPSHTPDLSLRPETQDPADQPGRLSSSRPRSSTYANGQPTPSDPHPPAENTLDSDTPATADPSTENPTPENSSTSNPKQKATIRFYPHHDFHRNNRPSLHFMPISRTLPSTSSVIRVGRYSERDGVPVANPGGPSDAPVGFKSKVVSRRHCEFVYVNGTWHVKDVGSSSGTFLNHMRLSQPTMVSRLYPIKDGDIVQLGIDFRGGEEMIFRCVRMRIECNRAWQQRPNEFNKNTESLIKNLGKGETADYSGCRECSICLGSVLRPYQCLFMAACAHVWHYKCVSPLIHGPEYPMFQCPNCRAYTDLSAEVDDSPDFDDTEQKESIPEVQMTPEERCSESEEPRAELEQPEQGEPEGRESRATQSGEETSRSDDALQVEETPQAEHEASDQNALHISTEENRPENRSPESTDNASDSSKEQASQGATPASPQPLADVPFSELPLHLDRLTSPSLEEALAINFDNLGVRDSLLFRTDAEGTRSPSSGPTTNGSFINGENHTRGWQSMNPLISARVESDTPVRSGSADDVLTPRNESGPLALDGRAGVQ
ncbi:FHA domain protein [Aspergillus sclerotialis]|uniref:FHA domain protein n=1 Tax=Aspergillus sclerotialis TaxID=2070753 RepID=A0A3A2ZLW9_9EURO|nr:FHA domain protein [Aspergillus sclerotialis]